MATLLATMARGQREAGTTFTVASLAFGLSGFSALAYQTAWQRMLGLFAGSDAVATTLIVGSFLFGLGLGSLAGGWLADRLSPRAALRAFGVAQLGVGIFAVLSPWILYGVVFHRLEPFAASLAGATLVTFAALALPTVLMGMTLPLIARALVQRIDLSPVQIGALYGVNTAGAGIGCLLTGFVLIAALGYGGSVRLAGGIDIAVGLGAMILSAALDDRPPASRLAPGPATDRSRHGLMLRWMVLVFLSGFLAISLEILWFRVLGTLMRSSAYSFSLVLGIFLLADALGILLGSYYVRRVVDPERLFLWLQAAIGVWAMGSLLAIYLAHTWLGAAALFIDGPPYGPPQRELLRLLLFAVLVGAVVAPAAIALGATFPIVQKAIQHRSSLIGWRLGLVQLANIMGNTAGAVVTGLVILRYVGVSGAFHLVGLLACLALLALVLVRRPGGILARPVRLQGHAVRLARWPALSAMAAALLVLLVALPGNARLWSGLHGTPRGKEAIVRSGEAGVAVLRPTGRGYILFVNGAFQAHLEPPLPLQTREPISEALGAIGPLVHPQASAALLIGYGAGNTVFNLGAGPAMARIRVVEIARPVIEAMRDGGPELGLSDRARAFRGPPHRAGDRRWAACALHRARALRHHRRRDDRAAHRRQQSPLLEGVFRGGAAPPEARRACRSMGRDAAHGGDLRQRLPLCPSPERRAAGQRPADRPRLEQDRQGARRAARPGRASQRRRPRGAPDLSPQRTRRTAGGPAIPGPTSRSIPTSTPATSSIRSAGEAFRPLLGDPERDPRVFFLGLAGEGAEAQPGGHRALERRVADEGQPVGRLLGGDAGEAHPDLRHRLEIALDEEVDVEAGVGGAEVDRALVDDQPPAPPGLRLLGVQKPYHHPFLRHGRGVEVAAHVPHQELGIEVPEADVGVDPALAPESPWSPSPGGDPGRRGSGCRPCRPGGAPRA